MDNFTYAEEMRKALENEVNSRLIKETMLFIESGIRVANNRGKRYYLASFDFLPSVAYWYILAKLEEAGYKVKYFYNEYGAARFEIEW